MRKQHFVEMSYAPSERFRSYQRLACKHRDHQGCDQVEHANELRSGAGRVDSSTNKCALLRRNQFEFVLFHLS